MESWIEQDRYHARLRTGERCKEAAAMVAYSLFFAIVAYVYVVYFFTFEG